MNDEVRRIARACSASDGVVDVADLVHLVPYVEGFLDPAWLSARLAELSAWVDQNSDPILQARLLHRPLTGNYLVAAVAAGRTWVGLAASDAWSDPPMGPKRLIQVAVNLGGLELHAGDQLDATARAHLRERLQSADNVFSALHEAATFAYLVRKGFHPQPLFLRKASRDEILLDWHGRSIPVQCKVKAPGAGRVIRLTTFTTLAGMIARHQGPGSARSDPDRLHRPDPRSRRRFPAARRPRRGGALPRERPRPAVTPVRPAPVFGAGEAAAWLVRGP